MKKKIVSLFVILSMLMALTACSDTVTTVTAGDTVDPETGDPQKVSVMAAFYDNRGNNFITFEADSFDIQPNRAKQWGYSTEGSYTSYYETSSVVTVKVDGEEMPTAGSTILFYDSRINLQPVDPDMLGTYGDPSGDGYEIRSADDGDFEDWFALRHWWYDYTGRSTQKGSKLVFIQSQDGYDIGIVVGNDVDWDIAEKLPKTTLITVDGMPLYIHRCNFIVIPTKLLENKQPSRPSSSADVSQTQEE